MPNLVQASTSTSEDMINPNQVYSYKLMQRDIERLAKAYPDLISYESLGQTKYGRELYAIKLGRGEAVLFLNGSHHAREWMTTPLLMEMIDTYASAYTNHSTISTYNVRSLLDSVSIWIVPMVNPDGVTLSQQGTVGLPRELVTTLRKYNGNSTNFNRWKANMQGIDLNRQYPAYWSTIKNTTTFPWYQNYKGATPGQALEVQMMMDFTYKIDPEMTISYHSSGEIIFWHFRTLPQHLVRDKNIANDLNKLTGYSLVKPEKNPSGGGYKDWFIEQFGRPGFTIEIGKYVGERSMPLSQFNGIWAKNKDVGLYAAHTTYSLWFEKQTVEYVQQAMNLLNETKLYDKIGANTGKMLAPQQIETIARKGDWYKINTDLGIGWIQAYPGLLTIIESHSEMTEEVKVNDMILSSE